MPDDVPKQLEVLLKENYPNHPPEMRAALAAAKKPCEIVVYPGAPHGFHADYRPSSRPEAAQDGWKRLQDWFRKHGVA